MVQLGLLCALASTANAWTSPSASAMALQGAINKAIAAGEKTVVFPDGDIFFNGESVTVCCLGQPSVCCARQMRP